MRPVLTRPGRQDYNGEKLTGGDESVQNTMKEKLTRGEKPIGTFVTTGSAAVVE